MSGRLLVIGAGIAGLAAALEATSQGREVLVIEASDAAGGVIQSRREAGYLYELGPNTIQASGKQLARLIDLAGLREQVLVSGSGASKRYIYRDGRMHALPTNPLTIFGCRAMSASGWWRVLQEPWQRSPASRDPEESVASFMSRRLGPEAVTYLVDPFVSGIYAGEASRLEVASAFPSLVEFESEAGSILRGAIRARKAARKQGAAQPARGLLSFSAGLQTLPQRVAALLGDHLLLSKPVFGLERHGDSWRVVTDASTHDGPEVVLALPAWAAASLLASHDPVLAELLAGITYAPIAVVQLGYRQDDFPRPPDGFGVLIPRNQGIATLGALFPSVIFPGRAPDGHCLVSAFIGGLTNPGILDLDEVAVQAQVQADLERVLGVKSEAGWSRIIRWERAIPQYLPGHAARISAIESRLASVPGIRLAGSYLRGISVDGATGSGFAAVV